MSVPDDGISSFRQRVEGVHIATPRASAPPENLWPRILDQLTSANHHQEKTAMTPSFKLAVPVSAQAPLQRRHTLSRALTAVASLLVVATLALSGWFALSNQPGKVDIGWRLAAITGTPASGPNACDVEPLTVDQVMAIVENPQSYMFDGATASPVAYDQTGSNRNQLRVMETDLELVPGNLQPTEQQFADASHVANAYLACLLTGTRGQVWSFYAPSAIQSTVLAEFPVFADEETVRSRVEDRLTQPAEDGEFLWTIFMKSFDIRDVSVNPDRLLAVSQDSTSSCYNLVLRVGIAADDENREEIYLSNGVGTALKPLDPMAGTMGMAITLAKSRSSDVWFDIPFPSLAEIEAM